MNGNEILTSIKDHNSITNLKKMMLYNPNIDLINVNVYTKFGKILSIHSQDIKGKQIFLTSIKDCNSVAKLQKMMHNNPNLDLVMLMCTQNFG